jgi:penicillin amidase
MDAEWASYGPEARAICESFVRGINAYVEAIERGDAELPAEFRVMGTRPAAWSAEDVVRIRSHGWTRNALSEAIRANVIARAGLQADGLRMNLEPSITPHAAEDLDLSSIRLNGLDAYRLAIAPVTFEPARLAATFDQAWQWTSVTPAGEVVSNASSGGSNNWAMHGSRTNTGRAILASDPHRAHSLPSLRYLIHLSSPDLDVIGAVEPNFPGITIGHNGHVAFGLTLFLGSDQEDVYVYELSPERADDYRYRAGWEQMRRIEETVDVKGSPPQPVVLKFTRHGPVVFDDADQHRAYAIRTVWSEPGTAPYGAALAAMRARTVEEFKSAMRRWRAPAVNQVCADVTGNIAWIAAGLTPIRRNWDGLLPVPGDGRYEWDGFLDPHDLPCTMNPESGFVASANAMNLPNDWDRTRRPMGYEWDEPSRARRIHEVLSGGPPHSLVDSCAMQADVVSLPARRLGALIRVDDLANVSPPSRRALALLQDWDHRLDSGSAPAALFEVWWSNYLRPSVIDGLVRDPSARALVAPGDVEAILRDIERIPATERRALFDVSLAAAYNRCVELFGDGERSWSWGRIHAISFEHVVWNERTHPAPGGNIAPLPLGGSESTLNKAVYRPKDFGVVMGASVRMVIDVGAWDNSVWINAPGQSGDPRSPHFADLASIWSRNGYVPMAYSRDAVEQAIERRLVLRP